MIDILCIYLVCVVCFKWFFIMFIFGICYRVYDICIIKIDFYVVLKMFMFNWYVKIFDFLV